MKPVVVYHDNCLDGLAAAWCFWSEFGDSALYMPWSYNRKPRPQFGPVPLFLVDFSFRREVLVEILKEVQSVTLIDHHKSILESLTQEPLEGVSLEHCSMEHSGCVLAWRFVKRLTGHNKEMPELLRHIEDRDLWRFKLNNTRRITAACYAQDFSLPAFHGLVRMPLEKLTEIGGYVEMAHWKNVNQSLKDKREFPLSFERSVIQFMIVNAPPPLSSDIGNLLSDEYGYGGTYYDTPKERIFSLRSKGTFDVAKIAEEYGGGGHRNAAGFSVGRNHFLAKW